MTDSFYLPGSGGRVNLFQAHNHQWIVQFGGDPNHDSGYTRYDFPTYEDAVLFFHQWRDEEQLGFATNIS